MEDFHMQVCVNMGWCYCSGGNVEKTCPHGVSTRIAPHKCEACKKWQAMSREEQCKPLQRTTGKR